MLPALPASSPHRSPFTLPKEERGYLLASLGIQLVVGLLFGHIYDLRIYMATGYLVASGQNPYIPQDLSLIFHNSAFQGMTSIGYPPPWALILGLVYLCSYDLLPNLLVYNLAIKLPIIAANIGLAYVVRSILNERGADPKISRKAWIFILFNPFLIYFTTAWGQFDSLVSLLTLLSLILLYKHKVIASAATLALAIALKPIAIPVTLVALLALWGPPWKRLTGFIFTFSAGLLLLCVVPFILLGWDPSPVLLHWNAVFTVSGGMALTTFYELLKNTYLLPGMWWLLGFVWVPAILVTAWWVKSRSMDLVDGLKKALVLILVFFLTRTWLSEPNLALILPLVLILTSLGELPGLALTATWVLPFVFTVFNTSPPQLLFPILPDLMSRLIQWMDMVRPARLIIRTALVIPWQLSGWWMVALGLKKARIRAS